MDVTEYFCAVSGVVRGGLLVVDNMEMMLGRVLNGLISGAFSIRSYWDWI